MRRLIAFGLVVIAAPHFSASAQESSGCEAIRTPSGQVILDCNDQGASPSVGTADIDPAVAPVPQWNVVPGPNGEYCISRTGWMDLTGLGPAEIESRRQFAANTYDALLVYGFRPCPGVEGPVTAVGWILEYLRAIDLPVPVPEIDPGHLLVGLEGFLETGSPPRRVIEDTSPFGPVRVELTSETQVTWGDGTVTDWTTAPDGPYPQGQLTHHWTHHGAYDITVTRRWVAAWSVGGQSGTVSDGLTTTGTLTGFPVAEVEAVIVG